jgi:hypothetical protein
MPELAARAVAVKDQSRKSVLIDERPQRTFGLLGCDIRPREGGTMRTARTLVVRRSHAARIVTGRLLDVHRNFLGGGWPTVINETVILHVLEALPMHR